jgi:hypothetical protein
MDPEHCKKITKTVKIGRKIVMSLTVSLAEKLAKASSLLKREVGSLIQLKGKSIFYLYFNKPVI